MLVDVPAVPLPRHHHLLVRRVQGCTAVPDRARDPRKIAQHRAT
jgi:hypothetical protein